MTVVDASAALTWILPDEVTPVKALEDEILLVSPVFPFKVVHALLRAERKRANHGP